MIAKPKREPVKKKVRFDVFKRDGFACQYCGRTPPAVTLEVDHVQPVCDGGTNHIDNLMTSCFDCNRGKGAEGLGVAPATIAEKTAVIAEREQQLKAYQRAQKAAHKRILKSVDAVEAAFQEHFPDRMFTDSFRASVERFLGSLTEFQAVQAMENAARKLAHKKDPGAVTKYFCGTCWRLIRGQSSYP